MADRIAEMFARTRAEGRPALIPFVPANWPEFDATAAIVQAAVAGGADALELGLAFSDPMADGATNQQAYAEAIAAGATTDSLFEVARSLRADGVRIPLLIMGYFNTLLAYGVGRFVTTAVEVGVDGLIIVDLPPEEAAELEEPARAAGLHVIYLLAPTSTTERIRAVSRHASGFIYCVSVTGVTGARDSLSDELPGFLERVRAETDVPLAVGFGISRREHVEAVGQMADGAVVGTAFVRTVAEAPPERRPEAVRAFVEELAGREPGLSESPRAPAAE